MGNYFQLKFYPEVADTEWVVFLSDQPAVIQNGVEHDHACRGGTIFSRST